MKLTPQVIEELTEFNWRWDFSFADIPAGIAVNTSQIFPLGGANNSGSIGWNGINNSQPQLKDGDIIVEAVMKLITPFANTADTAFNSVTASLGDQNSATRYFSAVQLNLNGTFVNTSTFTPNNMFIYTTSILPQYLQFTLNSMAAKTLSSLNQGKLYIEFQLFRAAAKQQILDLSQPSYV